MPVLKSKFLWKAVIYKVLRSVTAALLRLIKCKNVLLQSFKNLWLEYGLKVCYMVQYEI